MSSTDFVSSNQSHLDPSQEEHCPAVPKQQAIIQPQQVVNIAAQEELQEIHQNITEEIQAEKKREEEQQEEEQESSPKDEKPTSQKTKWHRPRDTNSRI